MEKTRFEWDEDKDRENQSKHNVSFSAAQHAFLDPRRVIAEDLSHSGEEGRFYCIGEVELLHHSEYIDAPRFESIRTDSEELVKILVSIVKTSKGTTNAR